MGERRGNLQQRKSTIFVDNLPNGIRKGFLYNLFSNFRRIRDCFIPNKKSKITGQSFGFVRFEYCRDAIQAIESTNGIWIWGQELVVNMARFLKKQDRSPTQVYNRHNKENLGDGVCMFRNQWKKDQPTKSKGIRPLPSRGNQSGLREELVPVWKNAWIQANNFTLTKPGERGKEEWRRKGQPESSKHGGDRRMFAQKDEGKEPGKTINVQAMGNGWLNRSAVGKMRRLISAQELEILFKKEKLGIVQVKPMEGRYVIITFPSEDRRNEILKEKWLELWFEEVNPWNGESAKKERFVWIACFGMPLNAWNVTTTKIDKDLSHLV